MVTWDRLEYSFFIREIGFWEVCLREILNNNVTFPGKKSNPVRCFFFREVNAGKSICYNIGLDNEIRKH